MFSINCLEITVTKKIWNDNEFQNNYRSIYKNLLSDKDFNNCNEEKPVNKRFYFNKSYIIEDGKQIKNSKEKLLPENFFEKGINIQAIVGENGAGKSTVMDLMYMAINNFCYMFERGNERPGAEKLYFVPHLNVNLYFTLVINNHDYACRLIIDDLKVTYECPYLPESINFVIHSGAGGLPIKEKKTREFKGKNDEAIAKIAANFFYTIVSNYSIQSFMSNNYTLDAYQHNVLSVGREKLSSDEIIESKSWINPIFHKNDGYIRSIVLNPYRDNGIIYAENEHELSRERVASLFLLTEATDHPKKIFFPPYTFAYLKIEKNTEKIIRYLNKVFEENKTIKNKRLTDFNNNLIKKFIYLKNDNLEKLIENYFNLKCPSPEKDKEKYENFCYCLAYIKIKLLKITQKYDSYKPFRGTLSVSFYNNSIVLRYKKSKIHQLLQFVLNDFSHITKKIRRTVNFLSLDNGKYKKELNIKDFKKKFDKSSVFFNKEKISNNVEPIELRPSKKHDCLNSQLFDDCLPPPLFDWQLILNKCDKNGKVVKVDVDKSGNIFKINKNGRCTKNGKRIKLGEVPNLEIPYNQLSSGECQFLETVSIYAYHLTNLVSVPENNQRPKYKNFNLVFDELEICFHPEMQRLFLKRLIDMLKNLGVNENNHINIFVITHSPFILSDIPSQKILYLKNGTQDQTKRTSPFAGNIGEMFYDSFFLKSTIGAFAEEKLKQLAAMRKNKTDENNAESIYDNIGNAVIKCLLSK